MNGWVGDAVDLARAWDDARSRSQQTEAGWSNMTDCRRELGYNLAGEWPTDDPDTWPAIVGTALHAWFTHLRRADYHRRGIPAAFGVPVIYRGIPGRLDEVRWPAEPHGRWTVTDYKFPGLASIDLWADDQYLNEMFIQPNGYACGLIDMGMQAALSALGFPPGHDVPLFDLDPDACVVQLLGMPVGSGTSFDRWQGHERPFSREAADAAADRYADVVAAQAAGEELPRDQDFWWCERFCRFFSLCRGFDHAPPRDLEEITDPEAAAAIEAYGLAGELIRANERVQRELRPLVEGRRGTARGWKVFHARGNPGKESLDEVAVEQLLGARGIPVRDFMRAGPPGKPKLTVSRVKAGVQDS